jgi:hypothetical protein
MIQFTCPGCPTVYTVDEAKAGKTGKCPKCQAPFVIPHTDPQSPDANAPVEIAPCPGCQGRLSVVPSDLGTNVECPYCQTAFLAKRAAIAEPEREADDRPRNRWDDEDNYDAAPRRRGKPGTVSAIGGLLLAGGIYALLHALASVLLSSLMCCVWPGVYFALVWSVLAIIRGSVMLRQNDLHGPPKALVIMQIILIVNFDVINCVLGIIGLILLNNPESRNYYDRFDD